MASAVELAVLQSQAYCIRIQQKTNDILKIESQNLLRLSIQGWEQVVFNLKSKSYVMSVRKMNQHELSAKAQNKAE